MKDFIDKFGLILSAALWAVIQLLLVLAKLKIYGDLSGLNWYGVFAFSFIIAGILICITIGYLIYMFAVKDEAKDLDKKIGIDVTKKQ